MKNLFIAFEGIDGSGKSTQVKMLADRLTGMGKKVYTTFEPTDSPIGSVIRNIMKGRLKSDHKTIAGLFVADRLDHLLNDVNGILKKLEEGYIVITDRYYFSSYAYHGVHMDLNWVIQANSMSAQILRPDLNIFIDIDPKTSMKRLHGNRQNIELYENIENLQRVREKYLEAFSFLQESEEFVIINGEQKELEISSEIWNSVLEKIGKQLV